MGCQKWSRGSPQTEEHMLSNPGTPQCHVPHGSTVPQHTQRAPVDQVTRIRVTMAQIISAQFALYTNQCLCLNWFGQTTCIVVYGKQFPKHIWGRLHSSLVPRPPFNTARGGLHIGGVHTVVSSLDPPSTLQEEGLGTRLFTQLP